MSLDYLNIMKTISGGYYKITIISLTILYKPEGRDQNQTTAATNMHTLEYTKFHLTDVVHCGSDFEPSGIDSRNQRALEAYNQSDRQF